VQSPISFNQNENTPTQRAAVYFERGYTPEQVVEIMKREKVFFPSIASVLNELLGKKNKSVEALAELSGLNAATIYRFMNNQRNPSRNALLRIAITLELSINETQVLLKSGNCAALTASQERDLIIMDGLVNKKYFDDINNTLIEKNLTDLNSRG